MERVAKDWELITLESQESLSSKWRQTRCYIPEYKMVGKQVKPKLWLSAETNGKGDGINNTDDDIVTLIERQRREIRGQKIVARAGHF